VSSPAAAVAAEMPPKGSGRGRAECCRTPRPCFTCSCLYTKWSTSEEKWFCGSCDPANVRDAEDEDSDGDEEDEEIDEVEEAEEDEEEEGEEDEGVEEEYEDEEALEAELKRKREEHFDAMVARAERRAKGEQDGAAGVNLDDVDILNDEQWTKRLMHNSR
jgi:hypothetical protein